MDYFLGSILEEQDLINFIGWFYSAKELKKIVKRLKKKTTEDEFIESRVLLILEREEKARIKKPQKFMVEKL